MNSSFAKFARDGVGIKLLITVLEFWMSCCFYELRYKIAFITSGKPGDKLAKIGFSEFSMERWGRRVMSFSPHLPHPLLLQGCHCQTFSFYPE